MASPPGEGAAWFYNWDCSRCTGISPGVELGVDYGVVRSNGPSYSVGASMNGVYPQLDGYLLLDRTEDSAFGVGARLGLPLTSWTFHQLYGRYDRALGSRKLLYNPGIGLHIGNSPNGQNPGHLLALVNAVGLELGGRNVTFVPSLSLVLATGGRTSYGGSNSFTTAFATIAASLSFHRARAEH